MAVAVPVQHAVSADEKAGLRVAFRIELDHVKPVAGDAGEEGNVVTFGHWMVDRDIMFVLDDLALHGVFRIRFFRFERRQRQSAAGNDGRTGAVQHVAADRADIQLRAQQIGCAVGIDDLLAAEQLGQGNLQDACQGFKQGNVGKTLARFP